MIRVWKGHCFCLGIAGGIGVEQWAWAAESAPPPGAGVGMLVPLALMFLVFFFLVIRPQQKKAKEHQQFLERLKSGDQVVTNSGIIGVVKNVSDKTVLLEVDKNVTIKVLKSYIVQSTQALAKEGKNKELSRSKKGS